MCKGVLMLQDNTSSYTYVISVAAVNVVFEQLVEQPLYSSNLVPNEYQLFPKLKQILMTISCVQNSNNMCMEKIVLTMK